MRIQRFVLGVSLALGAALVAAQPYPSRQVRIIQPLGVGSPGDLISRAIAQSLSQTLGQAFVVENKVGANGIIGMEACAKAPPDGYTLCIPSFSQVTMNPVLYAKLPYEPLKDLAPVINIGVINSAVVVNASVPVNNLRELMELGKAKPGQLNWGSWGLGSFPHLYATVLQNASGASFTWSENCSGVNTRSATSRCSPRVMASRRATVADTKPDSATPASSCCMATS